MSDLDGLRESVGGALAEAGIPLHDCFGPLRHRGGCCLIDIPLRDGPSPAGVIVGWTCADTLADGRPDCSRWDTYRGVQDAMTEALWALLETFGFEVVPYGQLGLPLVTELGPIHEGQPWAS
jgi:hypothetical protein